MIKVSTQQERDQAIANLEAASERYRVAMKATLAADDAARKAHAEWEDERTLLNLAKSAVIDSIAGKEIDE